MQYSNGDLFEGNWSNGERYNSFIILIEMEKANTFIVIEIFMRENF